MMDKNLFFASKYVKGIIVCQYLYQYNMLCDIQFSKQALQAHCHLSLGIDNSSM